MGSHSLEQVVGAMPGLNQMPHSRVAFLISVCQKGAEVDALEDEEFISPIAGDADLGGTAPAPELLVADEICKVHDRARRARLANYKCPVSHVKAEERDWGHLATYGFCPKGAGQNGGKEDDGKPSR